MFVCMYECVMMISGTLAPPSLVLRPFPHPVLIACSMQIQRGRFGNLFVRPELQAVMVLQNCSLGTAVCQPGDTTCDVPICICILQPIKNWRREQPGNEATPTLHTPFHHSHISPLTHTPPTTHTHLPPLTHTSHHSHTSHGPTTGESGCPLEPITVDKEHQVAFWWRTLVYYCLLHHVPLGGHGGTLPLP